MPPSGWSLKRRTADGTFVDAAFSSGSPGSELAKWLNVANPKIVDELEFAIRKANPWMQADMSAVEIRKEIERLQELEVQAMEREKGEGLSSNK